MAEAELREQAQAEARAAAAAMGQAQQASALCEGAVREAEAQRAEAARLQEPSVARNVKREVTLLNHGNFTFHF